MPGGVIFRVGAELCFLPAHIASKLLPVPRLARVPGAPPELVGLALVESETIAVVDVRPPISSNRPAVPVRSSDLGAMLVCTYLGERVGLVGIDIVATGNFETAPAESVVWQDQQAHPFDLGAVITSLREGRWAV